MVRNDCKHENWYLQEPQLHNIDTDYISVYWKVVCEDCGKEKDNILIEYEKVNKNE